MFFIFMLTRRDRTVDNALELVDEAAALGIGHIGFKDVGTSDKTLAMLNRRIQAAGAKSVMEMVDATPGASATSARLAADIGVDCLLGGHDADALLPLLENTGIDYFPSAGRPAGRPATLDATPEEIAADCRRAVALGCAGVNLLAYRSRRARPLALIEAARAALGNSGRLIVAGSISDADTVRELRAAGVDGFTIGTAVVDGRFDADGRSLTDQLEAVLAASRNPLA